MKNSFIIIAIFISQIVFSQDQTAIIDMHIHSYDQNSFWYNSKDYYGNLGSEDSDDHFKETYDLFKKYNIVRAVVCGNMNSVDIWKAKDTDNRIIRGIYIESPINEGIDTNYFKSLIESNKIQIFDEIGAYYSGTTLSDSIWQPYLRICEKYDIPVAIHTGVGNPGGTYTSSPKARLILGDPYLIEDVLVRYSKLRIYLMHSGEDWYEHAIRLMAYYPQLYSDLGAMLWVEPLTQRYFMDFIRNVKQ